jgi:kynureninase
VKTLNRAHYLDLDANDPLGPQRERFLLPAGVIYLDGNSLGALPEATVARVGDVVSRQWGERLVRSWNESAWTDWPRRIGAKIARLIGAQAHEVICTDSTSINLFKILAAALRMQRMRPQVRLNERRVILSERTNFPTDLYIIQGLIDLLGDSWELRLVDFEHVLAAVDEHVAAVVLSHVNYRTGARHDMNAITRFSHERGALTIWDLSHSAGAVPVDLTGVRADFAVGCGYKYLNGGPGAPGFVYVAERHTAALAEERFAQPLSGWFGHRTPFTFLPDYAPAPSIDRFAVGTPSILALAALECGVDTVVEAGIDALRNKSALLTTNFIGLVEQRCAGLGLELLSPADPERRGSQVCFGHPKSLAVMQALIARGVIGDVRDPDAANGGILRFGFAPLYVRHVDVWDAVEALRAVLAGGITPVASAGPVP